ncbi:MAG TPA: hypothetical protein VIE65_22400 [Methylobacter sp.]|jgi:hypothetical protein
MLILLLLGLVALYWRLKDIDPEGGCKDISNFSLCFDAWTSGYDGPLIKSFRKLPTDQELIDNLQRHRSDFDEALSRIFSRSFGFALYPDKSSGWHSRAGLVFANRWCLWPPKVYTSASGHFDEPRRSIEWAWRFPISTTKYIKEVGKDWPWGNRQKGYIYFPQTVPEIEHGRLIGPVYKTTLLETKASWRVLEQLDESWPDDWAHDECLLRRIEPHWFLYLCRDIIGE